MPDESGEGGKFLEIPEKSHELPTDRIVPEAGTAIETRAEMNTTPIIAAEHFELTPALREHIERSIEHINRLLPDGVVIRLFLKTSPNRDEYAACYRVHCRGSDLVAEERGSNLYQAIRVATLNLKKRYLERKSRKRELRRRG